MGEQNKNKDNRTIVGISGLTMKNSSITETKISASNSEAGKVGIFDSEMIDSEISKLNISDKKLSQEDKEELKSYGIEDTKIDDLNEIIQQYSNDKPSLMSKAFEWLSSVTSSLAASGISENISNITEFIHKVIQ